MATMLTRRTWTTPLLAAAIVLGGCGKSDGDAPAREPPPNPPAPAPTTPATADGSPATPSARAALLSWMDPDAGSVAYLHLPERLRSDATAVIWGLPPRAEDLLSAVTDVDHALDAVKPLDAPATDTWLSTEALVTTGRFARRPTVFHPLAAPRAEVITRLEAIGLTRQELDVFEVWVPQRVFPYKVVLLDNDVAAFIPASEPGSGVAPLASARDMPPSEPRTELTKLLGETNAPVVALFAAGPMLHLDLSASVLQVRFELRPRPGGGYDGQVALQLDGDLAESAKELEAHTAPEQSDTIQALVQRTAYEVEGPVVLGRLQLSGADMESLYESPP